MMRIQAAKLPQDFMALVYLPGQRATLELVGCAGLPKRRGPKRPVVASSVEQIPVEKLPEDWTAAIPMLRAAYHDTCAYLGLWLDPATSLATVDHFVPKSRSRARAYDWSNLRLSSHQMNTNKWEHEDVLDPFTIQDGWFELDLLTFEIAPGRQVTDADLRRRIQATIDRLKLNDPVYRDARGTFYDRYHGLSGGPPWPWAYVLQHAPYVAAELRRLNDLRPGDP